MATKEEVETVLTKYGQAYKAGDVEGMKKVRSEAYALAGVKVAEDKSAKGGKK